MYISEVRLFNFRSYQDAHVRLSPGINVLVGPNNTGKSNMLAALALLFGERYLRRDNFAHRDFYLPAGQTDPAPLLGVAARLLGTEDEIQKGEDWGAYMEHWPPADSNIGETPNPWNEEWWRSLLEPTARDRCQWLQGNQLVEELARAATSGELWIYVVCERDEAGELALGLLLKKEEQWFRLTRVRSAVREGLMTAAYLPAFRSPAESLRVTEWSWYGRLVRSLYWSARERRKDEFKTAEENISRLVQDAFGDTSSQVEEVLSEVVPGLKVRFKAGPFTTDDAHKAVTLFLDDGMESPYSEKGAGLQSLLVITLFRLYCERFHESSTLLLLEEPENHLHPHGRRALVAALRKFVEQNKTRRQVIVTTHSESLVRVADIAGLKLVRKGSNGSTFLDLPSDHEHSDRWQQIIRKNPEVVFAEHVILVEGGEEHLVPVIASRLLNEEGVLDRFNVSVVRVEGKMDFKKHVTMFEKLKIGWTVLTDRDFLKRGIEHFKDRLPKEEIETEEDQIRYLEDIGVIVNPKGQLEDLYTDEGKKLVGNGKDRAALKIAQALQEGAKLDEWFVDWEPIRKAIEHALAHVRRGME